MTLDRAETVVTDVVVLTAFALVAGSRDGAHGAQVATAHTHTGIDHCCLTPSQLRRSYEGDTHTQGIPTSLA